MSAEQTLKDAADKFHEILSALSCDELLKRPLTSKMVDFFQAKQRTPAQLEKIAADGFELCVNALAAMGASGVTIHACGEEALGETPWNENHD